MPIKFQDILPALPIVGSLLGNIFQRSQARADQERANIYASPKSQVERLKEAGLGHGFLLTGRGPGGQSAPIAGPQIDPTLGTAKSLETHFTSTMQQKQLELMDAEIYNKTQDGRVKAGQADWMTTAGPTGRTNQAELLRTKLSTDQARLIGQDIANSIKGTDLAILKEFGRPTAEAKYKGLLQANIGQGLKNQGQALDNEAQQIANEIQRKYGMPMAEAQLKNVLTATEAKHVEIAQRRLNLSVDEKLKEATALANLENLIARNDQLRQAMRKAEIEIGDSLLFGELKREMVREIISKNQNIKGGVFKELHNIMSVIMMKILR